MPDCNPKQDDTPQQKRRINLSRRNMLIAAGVGASAAFVLPTLITSKLNSDPVMANTTTQGGGVFQGTWSYRSFSNDPDLSLEPNDLLFGEGNLTLEAVDMDTLSGALSGPGFELDMSGSISYGNPYTVWFQGDGVIGGNQWIYQYLGYLVPNWPNGVDQTPTMVGSVVRVIPHPGGDGGLHPAGVVASWYAAKQA